MSNKTPVREMIATMNEVGKLSDKELEDQLLTSDYKGREYKRCCLMEIKRRLMESYAKAAETFMSLKKEA